MARMEEPMTGLEVILRRAGLVLLLTATLVSCAVSGDRTMAPAAGKAETVDNPAPAADELPKQALTDELMYDILLAEIAGQRGVMDVSVPHYLQAAMESRDPRVAERAMQVASFAKQYDIALQAARRWVELDGDNIEARKGLTALALQVGDMDEVISQVDYLLSISTDPEEGYRLATAVLVHDTDKQAALEVMRHMVDYHPDNAYAWMALCRMAVLADELEQALEAADQALARAPGLTAAIILKAQVLVRLDRKADATELLRNAVAAHPDDTDLHFAYGRMLLDADQLEQARAQFAEVVKLDPENIDGLYSLALLELETRQFKSGEKHLKQLLALNERQQNVYYYLGYAAREQGDEAAALEWYRKVESGDYWSRAQVSIAEILLQQDKLDEMQAHMRLLRQKNPSQAEQFYLLEGQVLSDAGLTQSAYEIYTTALAADPDSEDLLYARALTAEKLGDLDAAEQDMRRILANDPENVRTMNALGYTLADKTDRYDEALAYITRAYEKTPEDPAIIDSMGWVQYRLGNLDIARQYLQQAWDMTNDSEIGAHLGEVMWQQGDYEAARKVWEQAREFGPDNAVLQETLKRFNP
jgi:tetratricopeptide (TPR) repeat protein